jgi:hypothetical protein
MSLRNTRGGSVPDFVYALEVVGDEVWAGSRDTNLVRRLDLAGNLIGEFDVGAPVDAIESLGNEVWIGDYTAGVIRRFNPLGEQLGQINVGLPNVSALLLVPEPSTALLLAFGLVGIAAGRRRRAARSH